MEQKIEELEKQRVNCSEYGVTLQLGFYEGMKDRSAVFFSLGLSRKAQNMYLPLKVAEQMFPCSPGALS